MHISIFYGNRPILWHSVLIVILVSGLMLNLWGLSSHPVYAATFDVDRTDDDPAAMACTATPNDCSLRGAISAAGGLAGADTINVPPGTYTLVGSELVLDSDISLIGAGAASTIIQADANPGVAAYRVMSIIGSANIIVSSVTIQYGVNDVGGGISNLDGRVTITGGTVVSDNLARSGGGIYNAGHMIIIGSAIISNNEAAQFGGGIYNEAGQLTLSNRAVVSSNVAAYYGGGIFNDAGSLLIDNATVSDNTATDMGGGGLTTVVGTVTVRNSLFSGNTAFDNYGGGAILSDDNTMSIIGSAFTNNQGYDGGALRIGIEKGSTVNIITSTFSENTATGEYGSGGAIYSNGELIVTRSTFINNSTTGEESDGGGALYHINYLTSISNSTFSGNYTTGGGGGIYFRNNSMSLSNVTIMNNSAANGGGLFFVDSPDVGNTIIAGNSSTNTGPDCTSSGGSINSRDHNLIGDPTGCQIGGTTDHNLLGVDPLLGLLQNNGGPTLTQMPLAGSPAIDAGDNDLCAEYPLNNLDQRGVVRPFDGNGDGKPVCDIGSVEVDTVEPDQTVLSIDNITVTEGNTGTVEAIFTVTRTGATDVISTVDYTAADDTATVTGNDYVTTSGTLMFAPNEATQTITVLVNGDTIDEGTSEQFIVSLSNPTSATIQNGTGIGTIIDDDTSLVILTESVGSTQISEGGATDTYTLQLRTQPTAEVSIGITPDDQCGLGLDVGIPMAILFTPENYDVPQTLTVIAFDDAELEGQHTCIIEHSAASIDPAYNDIPVPNLIAQITDNDGVIEDQPSAEDHARAQAPQCSLIGGGSSSVVRADVLGGTVSDGSVFCRIIAQDGGFITGPEQIGNADVIGLGVIQAVDVFGLKHDGTTESYFNYAVKVCLQGMGRLFYLDATTYPRALSQLPTTFEFGYTCGLIANAGTVVLVP